METKYEVILVVLLTIFVLVGQRWIGYQDGIKEGTLRCYETLIK